MLIGLDFDNTLISYGHVFRELAIEFGLAPLSILPDKTAVRTHVWAEHDDIEWQKLQAQAYGPRIGQGQFMDGAADFLHLCRKNGVDLCVVSHKSKYASIDPGGFNLRTAALGWMEEQGFFSPLKNGGFGFHFHEIFFETTRSEKIARINDLGCDVFVDDLVEVLSHEDLKSTIERILFQEQSVDTSEYTLAGPWSCISEYLFSRRLA